MPLLAVVGAGPKLTNAQSRSRLEHLHLLNAHEVIDRCRWLRGFEAPGRHSAVQELQGCEWIWGFGTAVAFELLVLDTGASRPKLPRPWHNPL